MLYKEIFDLHPVKSLLIEIKNLLSETIIKYPDSKNLDEIIKIDSSIQYISNVILNANIYITPKNHLDNINSHLTNVKNSLNQYHANRANQLPNIISYLEQAVVITQQIIQNNTNQNCLINIDPKDMLESLTKSSEATISTLNEKTNIFNQLSDEYIIKLKNAENNFNLVQQRVDTLLNNLQTNYNSDEKTRRENFEKDILLFKTEFNSLILKLNTDNNKNELDLNEKAEKLLKEIELKNQKAGEILQIVSNTGFAGNYSKNADFEKKNANVLRIISIVIFSIVAGLALIILFTFQKEGLSWQETLVRVLATSLPTALATYLAKESGKHRKLERIYRNMELELSALDAFIENIPNEERNKLKIEITKKLFSDDSFLIDSESKKEGDSNVHFSIPESINQIIGELLKSLKK